MRIVHFVEALKGGPASYLNALLPFQADQYQRVAVLCPRSQAQFINTPNVDIFTFPDTERSLFGIARLMAHWRQHLATNHYDIAHLHSSFAGLVGRFLADRNRAPKTVYCAHGWSFAMETSLAKRAIYRAIENRLACSTDTIVNVSSSEQALAYDAGIPQHRSRLVLSGIADRGWTPLQQDKQPTRLLFVGRFDRQKGLDILLKAMEVLEPLGFSLTTIGGPVVNPTPAYEPLPFVTNLGWSTPLEIAEAMDAADIIVMPSRWEGLSLVAIEAMRAGRPIVASAVGGMSDLVVHQETGLLYAPNTPSALADAVIALSSTDVREMGRKARQRYESGFTAARMFETIDALYRGLGSTVH